MVSQNLPILIGDANGADRAVQQYLSSRQYENVQVYCMKGHCRNNAGVWPVVEVSAPRGVKGAEFYSLKDQEMTQKASVGLMLWDGKSTGTLANIIRLIEQQKPVVVYQAKLHEVRTIKTSEDLRSLLSQSGLESEEVLDRLPQASTRTLF